MKRGWILFVSLRHFRTKRREKGHTAGVLSVLGIAMGVMTLVAVLAVMNGFQFGTIQDILEVGGFHLQVEADDPLAASTAISGLPGVESAVPYAEQFGLVSGYFRDPVAVLVRALPATVLDDDAGLADSLDVVAGRFALGEPGAIVLGEELARRIGARVGDEVELIGFDLASGAPGGLGAASPRLRVEGVFKTGFLEYDAGWAFVSLATAHSLLATSPTTIGVKLSDRFADRDASSRIVRALPAVRVESWRDYNRSIFGALRLEKVVMMLMVGLIFVVVAVNIFQSLRRSVVERTEEIGVLRALGASPLSLQAVFVFEGLWIGVAGASLGTLLGVLVSTNINRLFGAAEVAVNAVGWVIASLVGLVSGEGGGAGSGSFSLFSSSYFYLDEVPAVIASIEVAAVFAVAVLSATIAAYGASRRAGRITPAEVLRFE